MVKTQSLILENRDLGDESTSQSRDKNRQLHKCFQLIENTYGNNIDSDYTEKIAELGRGFRYQDNRDYFWVPPNQSLLYGTQLYAEASTTQQLALNHLSWAASYSQTAFTESNALEYNPVTAGVLESIGGYDTLVQEITRETEQEIVHISTFRKIGLTTMASLIGRNGLNEMTKWLPNKPQATVFQHDLAKKLAKFLTGNKQTVHYSTHLEGLSQKKDELLIFQTPMDGLMRSAMGPLALFHSFYGFSCGSGSPFMVCQFYTLRMVANLALKNLEQPIAKYAKHLANNDVFVPIPTTISRYHFLDEAFHTTISQVVGKDLYHAFDTPNFYEKLIANSVIYMMQRGSFGALSAVNPVNFHRDQLDLFALIYYLLRSPVFGFNHLMAKEWVKRCFCEEHDGLHAAVKHRTRLFKSLKRFTSEVGYLWPINRDMKIMAKRGSIADTLQQNIQTFDAFSKQLELLNHA